MKRNGWWRQASIKWKGRRAMIAWLRGKCIALCVMLSSWILRGACLLSSLSFSLSPSQSLFVCVSPFFSLPLPLCASYPSALMIHTPCHTARLSDAHWQYHSCGNIAVTGQEMFLTHTQCQNANILTNSPDPQWQYCIMGCCCNTVIHQHIRRGDLIVSQCKSIERSISEHLYLNYVH